MSAASAAGVRLAITLGDPRGIGPEVAAAALAEVGAGGEGAGPGGPGVEVVGPGGPGVASGGPGRVGPVRVIGPAECAELFRNGRARASSRRFEAPIAFEAVGGGAPGLHPGRAAGLAIERAAELALAGEVEAVVTAPIHKPAMLEAGFHPGHTEMLTALSGAREVGMLMCDESGHPDSAAKRVLLATIHIPLRTVADSVTPPLLVSQTRLLGAALQSDWAIAAPRIALCALNPHASDDGLFGAEEAEVYAPAISALAADPWDVFGPVPADTVFARAFRGEFDAVVAPYHDVGMAAFKTACFGRGVNVTIGLPFARTSPDHGTAFDIAGRGVADPSSMIEAVRLALRLAGSRRGAAAALP